MLNLLLRQPYTEEAIRTDFIDFCLTRLADPKSPYAVRAQCIKLAYVQMRYWPELLNELRQTLEMISCEPLSPGLFFLLILVIKISTPYSCSPVLLS